MTKTDRHPLPPGTLMPDFDDIRPNIGEPNGIGMIIEYNGIIGTFHEYSVLVDGGIEDWVSPNETAILE